MTVFPVNSEATFQASKESNDAAKVMVRLDSRVRSVETNIETLTKQLEELSLIIKKCRKRKVRGMGEVRVTGQTRTRTGQGIARTAIKLATSQISARRTRKEIRGVQNVGCLDTKLRLAGREERGMSKSPL